MKWLWAIGSLCLVQTITLLIEVPVQLSYGIAIVAALRWPDERAVWGCTSLSMLVWSGTWLQPWFVTAGPLCLGVAATLIQRRHMQVQQPVVRALWYLCVACLLFFVSRLILSVHSGVMAWAALPWDAAVYIGLSVITMCGLDLLMPRMRMPLREPGS